METKSYNGIEIVSLNYSQVSNDFYIRDNARNYVPQDAVTIAPQMDKKDATVFIGRMHRKYVAGRKTGRYPSLEIVQLELQLFMKLKG
ncbi:MAG: hypothetical protein IJ840_06470 [Bacteroidales bacterium]|nr:hypothetical protein [Bacteroidales bacterium]